MLLEVDVWALMKVTNLSLTKNWSHVPTLIVALLHHVKILIDRENLKARDLPVRIDLQNGSTMIEDL